MSRSFLFCVTLISAMTIGCNGGSEKPTLELHPATGKVMVGGELAEGVTVTFVPVDGADASQDSATGVTDSSGAFKMISTGRGEGVATGSYRVLFAKLEKPDGSPLGPDEMAADAGAENVLPSIYNSITETPVGAEVKAGGSEFSFDLRSK